MRILFIYTNINVRAGNFGKYPAIQFGISSISSMLKDKGHDTQLLLFSDLDDLENLFQKLQHYSPDIVAFTSVTTQFEYITFIAEKIKKRYPQTFQICGGHHVTLAKEEAIKEQPLDAICIGEGELPMLELIENMNKGCDYRGIENLYFKTESGRIIKNKIRPFNQDLDNLPFFDRDLFKDYSNLETYPHSILTTRGCYFNCSYCCNHAFKNIASGKYVRSRSVGNVIDEVKLLTHRFPKLKYLYIEDETIGQNRKYWEELLPLLKKTGLKFGTNYRIGTTSLDFLDLLRQTNFVKINIGIESGNEFIRTKVLNRKYSNKQIIDTFNHARKLGMLTKSYNLIGLPHETPQMFNDTIQINKIVQPDETMLNIFYPYPGTKLDSLCDEMGLKRINCGGTIRERTESILNLPTFPRDELMFFFQNWKKSIRGNLYQRTKKVFRKHIKQIES